MIIINTVQEFLSITNEDFYSKASVGFVPTMGALHQGHLSLVECAKKENDLSVVSIFVNPKQFNDVNDFAKYPKTLDSDIKLLEEMACDIVFIPGNDDIYKDYNGCLVDLDGLDNVLEGKYRKGHFQGVVDIVYRLFDIVNPNRAYFGKKDYQQLLIIKKMVEKTNLDVKVIGCPIVREDSGLAMSSRNKRLSNSELISAKRISEVLHSIEENDVINTNPKLVAAEIIEKLNHIDFLITEYVEFCEPNTLESVRSFEKNTDVIVCLAVFCGEIRLIDNKVLHF